jgi:hypothetical protein
MMKLAFFLTTLLAFVSAFAQDSDAIALINNNSTSLDQTQYEVEGQIHTISLAPGVTFGPSIQFKSSPFNAFGFRMVAPISRNDDLQLISMGGFWRHYFSEKSTSLFTEVGGGVNFATFENEQFVAELSGNGTSFFSAMANFGVLHKINEDIGFGGYGGVDIARVRLSKNFISYPDDGRAYIYPRLSMFASIAF